MNQENRQNHPQGIPHSSGTGFNIDYKKLLADTLRFWWLFALTIALSLFVVYMLHRYAQPVYRASLTLLVEERGSDKPQSNMMEGFGLSSAMRSIENQVAILTSWEMMRMAIGELDFELAYYKTGRVKSTELYGSIPFTVEYDKDASQLLNVPIYLSVQDAQTFRLHIDAESGSTWNYRQQRNGSGTGPINFSGSFRFGEWIETPWMRIRIINHNLSRPEEKAYFFHFNSPDALASAYKARFTHGRSNDNSSIVRMFVTGHNNPKNVVFLNKLAEVFIRNNLERKNQIATNTIQFIEEQLLVISDSLSVTGNELSRFRTTHQIQSVSAQAGIYFTRLENLAEQTSEKMLMKKYYEYLSTYFSSDSVFEGTIAPASYPVDHPAISSQIQNLMDLNIERQSIAGGPGQIGANPYLVELQNKLEVGRLTLLKALENQTEMVDQELGRIEEERRKTTAELYQFPEKERQLFGIERQFDLNNEVYTFLLRKRSEAQIQKASNTPDHSILEAARPVGQVSPTVNSDRQKALLIGFLLPALFLLIRQLLNNKIHTTEDIERITKVPVIGHIIHNNKEDSNVVDKHPKSIITETFRRIRSRLDYMVGDTPCPIIAVSSSMPGEGKTFTALNLASVFAISGKKTLLVGFDMRKPGLSKVLHFEKHVGLSNYLIGQVRLKDIIQESSPGNLYVLPSGAIPPNPSELIGSPKAEELFKELKKQFDIILLDTPPMGVVADGYLLARHADSVVFITRQDFTIREVFAHTIQQMQEEGIKNIGVLLNDIQIKKGLLSYNYGYGYGYGNGYGNGYYED